MNVLKETDNYRIGGRYTWQDGKLCLAFSASYVEFAMHGSRVTAVMESDEFAEDETLKAWVAVFVDGGSEPVKRFPLKKGSHSYELLADEQASDRVLRIMKYSENAFGMVAISTIDIGEGKLLPCPGAQDTLIEFIGDSITCGYGIEGVVERDTFTTAQENPWEAYACLTARRLGADFALVSWSGNGVISHFVEDTVDEPRHDKPFMQELYPYADLELESRLQRKEYTLWNPARKPDVIVIHLGTNDCSYARELEERNAMYREAYVRFVGNLRQKYPSVPIVCMLGLMDQRLNGALAEAVEQIRGRGDTNTHFLEMPLQREEDGIAADYHPSRVTHEKAAERLCLFLQDTDIWRK